MKTEIQIFGLSDESYEQFTSENWAIISPWVAWNECRSRAMAQISFLERQNEELRRQLNALGVDTGVRR